MEVKTFDNEKLAKLLMEADPYIVDYIEAIKRTMEISIQTNSKAIQQIRELSDKLRDKNNG